MQVLVSKITKHTRYSRLKCTFIIYNSVRVSQDVHGSAKRAACIHTLCEVPGSLLLLRALVFNIFVSKDSPTQLRLVQSITPTPWQRAHGDFQTSSMDEPRETSSPRKCGLRRRYEQMRMGSSVRREHKVERVKPKSPQGGSPTYLGQILHLGNQSAHLFSPSNAHNHIFA
jgi:hypothetical protein